MQEYPTVEEALAEDREFNQALVDLDRQHNGPPWTWDRFGQYRIYSDEAYASIMEAAKE